MLWVLLKVYVGRSLRNSLLNHCTWAIQKMMTTMARGVSGMEANDDKYGFSGFSAEGDEKD